jgi:hypothetical protein
MASAGFARCVLLAFAAAGAAAQTPPPPDPFSFFSPAVAVTSDERARLARGDAVVKVLPARDREVAIFSAARIDADGDRLAAWVRQIADLKNSEHVPAIARFSHPPRLGDLSALSLDDDDLNDIRRCRPRDCGLKLNEEEIAALRQAVADGGQNWKPLAQDVFRRLLLTRVTRYLEAGHAGMPPYRDHETPVHQSEEFAFLAAQSGFLNVGLPGLLDHIERYPHATLPAAESFLYWSKEILGGRPVVSITHVTIVRGRAAGVPDALVAAKQVYASHYMTGSFAVTAVVGGGPARFLVYLNRSRVDVLSGFFGGLARRLIERRLRGDAAGVVSDLRRRIESGPPPAPL